MLGKYKGDTMQAKKNARYAAIEKQSHRMEEVTQPL